MFFFTSASSKPIFRVQDCTADEFHLFMTILNMTSIPKTVSGQAQLLEITSTMADLDKPFNATDVEAVDKFVQCAKVATGFFSVRKSFHRTFFTINQIRL